MGGQGFGFRPSNLAQAVVMEYVAPALFILTNVALATAIVYAVDTLKKGRNNDR